MADPSHLAGTYRSPPQAGRDLRNTEARDEGLGSFTVTRELEAAAMRDSIGLSPARIAEIKKEAEAYAAMVEEIEKAEKAKERRQFFRDLTQDFIQDFRSAFDQAIGEGKSKGEAFWEAFKTAGLNALDRIVDKLLNEVLDAVFQINQAGSGGGGGGFLSSLFGSIFGGGNAFPGAPVGGVGAAPGGLGLWANGGYTGSGGKYDPAGVVHRGEFVFNQDATRRIGVGNLNRLHRGYDVGGLVGAPAYANQNARAPANQNGGTTTMRLIMPEGWRAELVDEARGSAREDAIQIVQETERARENRYQNGSAR